MSTEQDKFKHSKRLLKDQNAIKKQTKIAKQHGIKNYITNEEKEPHRFNKHHAMDCGNTKCYMCSNPRRTHKSLSNQEKRLFQDLDSVRDTHSNGLKNDSEDFL